MNLLYGFIILVKQIVYAGTRACVYFQFYIIILFLFFTGKQYILLVILILIHRIYCMDLLYKTC